MNEALLDEAVRLLRRFALLSGFIGLVLYVGGIWLIYVGVITPFEATLPALLGLAGIVASLVLVILAAIARRLRRPD